jgi:predicted DNA-binding transcriptional regulator AlpA
MSGRAISLHTRITLNREEAAEAIGVSPVVFDRMVAAGELPTPHPSKVSTRKFWVVSELEAAMRRLGIDQPEELAPADEYEDVSGL